MCILIFVFRIFFHIGKRVMPRKSTSPVWYSLEKIDEDTVKCKICSTTLRYNGSTGSMLNHLKLKHPCATTEKHASTTRQSTLGSFLSRKTCNPERSQQITELIAEMITVESLPISLLAADGFRTLLAFLEPGYNVPCRATMSTQLNRMYQMKKETVKDKLTAAGCVSLTTVGHCLNRMVI